MAKFVDRPQVFKNSNPIVTEDERLGLLRTAENGKAVVIALDGRSVAAAQRILRSWLSTRGYRFHYRLSHDRLSLISWAEKI